MARGRRKVGAINPVYQSFTDEILRYSPGVSRSSLLTSKLFAIAGAREVFWARVAYVVDLADAALSGVVGMLRFPHAPYSDYCLGQLVYCCYSPAIVNRLGKSLLLLSSHLPACYIWACVHFTITFAIHSFPFLGCCSLS